MIIPMTLSMTNHVRCGRIAASLLHFLISPCLIGAIAYGQQPRADVLDTAEVRTSRIILYKNHTWSYLKDTGGDSNGTRSSGVFDTAWIGNQINAYGKTKIPFDTANRYDINLLESESEFCMPVEGHIVRGMDYRHDGVDISLETGDSIYAAFDGKVRYAMYNTGGYGNLIIVRHMNGLETYYAHLSGFLCLPNQDVRAGDPIGLVGNTGHSKGSHLHFEFRFMDVPLDPQGMIDFAENTLKSDRLTINANDIAKSHASTRKVHKIKKGETLAAIARKYHTTTIRLAKLNHLKKNAKLRTGRRLIIG